MCGRKTSVPTGSTRTVDLSSERAKLIADLAQPSETKANEDEAALLRLISSPELLFAHLNLGTKIHPLPGDCHDERAMIAMALSPAAQPSAPAPCQEKPNPIGRRQKAAAIASYKPVPPRHGIAEAYVPSEEDRRNALSGQLPANWIVRLLRFFGF
ncbi:hypothetical protein [Aestuariivirga sp.]|uniref:hypothetical protein n=1 Tax=Aestuariivirga sp. TaxID=2650926 RepID=UPI0039E64A9B